LSERPQKYWYLPITSPITYTWHYPSSCCGASEPEASERSSSLICAERGFWTKFYLAHGIVVVRAFYAHNTNFKLARVFEFLSNF
jgi:hypothetical protein